MSLTDYGGVRALAHEDVADPAVVRAALRRARSVALSRAGASGVFMTGLLERLGIAEEVNRKATFIASGLSWRGRGY